MPTRIAILHPTIAPWVARTVNGIRQYAKEQGDWHIFSGPTFSYGAEKSSASLQYIEGWQGDGIILASNELDELKYATQLGIPCVNLAAGLEGLHGVARVAIDNYEAGRVAAEHLVERGLTNLAFYGWKDLWYSEQRYRGFREQAEEWGVECSALLRPWGEDARGWFEQIATLVAWLQSIPLPCGIFAVHDFRAQMLLEACAGAGLKVPEDVAVIGMDNNETVCEHSVPKLTSIARNSFEVGYEAAALLDRMMKGESDLPQEILIPPRGVIERESSDMMYCDDPLVQQAIEYIRRNIGKQFNIEAIADHLGVSKRKLERKFSDAVDCSPHLYLTRLRVQHAQARIQLNPKKTMDVIASECGFTSLQTFHAAFQRITGKTPSSFRPQRSDAEHD